jgi:molybdopterin-guanine dinucleotide biosynthesis protein A
MGTAKAALAVPGGTLVERPIATLTAAGLDAVVVAKPDSELPPLAVPCWGEPSAPRHPLCGIVAALERHGGPIVVLACDLPFVPAALAELLATTIGRAVVPSHTGGIEPLAARYEPAALPGLREGLATERSLRQTVAALDPIAIDESRLSRMGEPRRMFANVNSPRDLELLSGS